MKKVRFMLLTIAVIAIAGGTLAFKAKYNATICVDQARTHPNHPNVYTCVITDPVREWEATCDFITDVDTLPENDQITLCYTLTEEETCEWFVTGTDCKVIVVDTILD